MLSKGGRRRRRASSWLLASVMNFVRIPAGSFVMGSNRGHSDYSPVSKQVVKKAFWMGEIEVSNEQFRTIFPEHNSRFIGQLWKDHVHKGYPANNPEQPAIRVSWQEAMDFCKKLSEKTGLNVTLPTEVQWEWACRAGSDDDFWYGSLNTDFAKFENLADVQLNKAAVRGVNPQPMNPNDSWYKYYTYQPKENGCGRRQYADGERVAVIRPTPGDCMICRVT